MDFLAMVNESIDTKKKIVSLKTLTKKETEKIMRAYKQGKDVADNHYKDTVEPAIIKRKKVYEAPIALYKEKFPVLSELSNWISRDVKTTIDWIMPSLLETFTGTDDPADIKGANLSDDEAAAKIQSVVKYQAQKKNNLFAFLYHFIREGLITNEGVAKVYWKRDEQRTEMKVMVDETNMADFMQGLMDGTIEIKKAEEVGDGIGIVVTYDKIDLKYNAPVLEVLSPSELRFTPESRTLQECKFVSQRKIVKGDYLKRREKEGVYRNVDKAIKEAGSTTYTTLDVYNNSSLSTIKFKELSDADDASKDVELIEAYLKVDYNDDGIYESVIVHAVGDTPLAIQENEYEKPPFFIFAPENDAYTVFGKASYADNLEQLQDLKTALIRQIIIATGKNNKPQKFVQTDKVDIDALLNGEEIIGTDDNPASVIMTAPPINLSPYSMELVQYAQNEVEAQSGSTRYNQGLDSNSLNRTATGINAIMGAADKRIKMVARLFAETAWIPIIKFLILLNQKFLTPNQQFRINDEMVSLSPEELNIDYDLTINTGQGAGTKEAQLNYLIVIIQQLYPKLEQVGIVDENSWYEITKDLLEKMGIRNVGTYLTDPKSPEGIMKKQQQMQMAQQMAQQQAQQPPKLSVNYRDLPIDAKTELLNNCGVRTTPQAVAAKENSLMRTGR